MRCVRGAGHSESRELRVLLHSRPSRRPSPQEALHRRSCCRSAATLVGMARLEIIVGGQADPSGRRVRPTRRGADLGQLLRLAPGRFVDADAWRSASPGERHIARIKAVCERIAPRLVVSHASAAALHGLPWRGEFPEIVDVLDPTRATTQTLALLRKRPAADRDLRGADRMVAGGRRLTSIVMTSVDIALAHPLRTSVPVIDAALRRGTTEAELETEPRGRGHPHGRARAEYAISLGDARSDSAGESIARVALDEVGAPPPELQREFRDAQGVIGRVDFWFPEQRAVLEFDGRIKYADPGMRRVGDTAADVVVHEKRREDRLRRHPGIAAVGRVMARDCDDTAALRDVLRSIGVPTTPRRFDSVR